MLGCAFLVNVSQSLTAKTNEQTMPVIPVRRTTGCIENVEPSKFLLPASL